MSRVQTRLDELAQEMIRGWFSYVLGRELPAQGKTLALLRLAFLDANYDGRWSVLFLSPDVPVQGLAGELDAMMIEPTPASNPRVMTRQVF